MIAVSALSPTFTPHLRKAKDNCSAAKLHCSHRGDIASHISKVRQNVGLSLRNDEEMLNERVAL
jgi:hypothetical protein